MGEVSRVGGGRSIDPARLPSAAEHKLGCLAKNRIAPRFRHILPLLTGPSAWKTTRERGHSRVSDGLRVRLRLHGRSVVCVATGWTDGVGRSRTGIDRWRET